MKFAVTFGQRYQYEPHPHLGMMPNLPAGWFTIEAVDEMGAREKLRDLIDNQYAFLYTEETFEQDYHPVGTFGDIEKYVNLLRANVASNAEGSVTISLTVRFTAPREVFEKVCPCGAPVEEWRSPTGDGDSEPHAHCLNRSCALSSY